MKTNSPQSMAFESKWRRVVVLFAFLSLICLAVTSRSAQSKNPRRVTALHVGEAAEGSRVTIVSDSALNDYEAFRRGDRFYVRIPLADFTAVQPSFRSIGFEDVRVQEVGEDVIVSFKLQPGASARVDQHSNRLEVVFSALGGARNATAANSYPTTRKRRNTGNTDAIAGPMPPASPLGPTSRYVPPGRTNYPASPRANSANNNAQALRSNRSPRRDVTGTGSDPNNIAQSRRSNNSTRRSAIESGADPNNIAQSRRSNSSTRPSAIDSGAGSNSKSNSAAEKLPSETKKSLTSPTSSPGTSGSVSTVATPAPISTPTVYATPSVQQPASAPVSVSSRTPEATGWESRVKFLKAWAKINQSALMVGGLIALALLIGLVMWSRLKGRGTVTGKASPKTRGKPVTEKAVAAHAHRDADQEREVFEL